MRYMAMVEKLNIWELWNKFKFTRKKKEVNMCDINNIYVEILDNTQKITDKY